MFATYNYFKQYNNDEEIKDFKEFYKNFSNEREFGSGNFQHFDHLIKNRFMNIYGHMNNIVLRKMPNNLLDIGCGAGINLPLSKTYDFIDYHGIDYAEKTLSHSRKMYPNVSFKEMDAFNLEFDEKTFDMAIISGVLILYENIEDRINLLNNARKVLKDDGVLIAIIWNDAPLLRMSFKLSRIIAKIKGIKLPTDFNGLHFKKSEAAKMFSTAGFNIEERIDTASLYGILESTKYLNMTKYRRNFGKAEQEINSVKEQNILKDLKKSSNSSYLISFFYYLSKIFPSSFNMFSIYVLKKEVS